MTPFANYQIVNLEILNWQSSPLLTFVFTRYHSLSHLIPSFQMRRSQDAAIFMTSFANYQIVNLEILK